MYKKILFLILLVLPVCARQWVDPSEGKISYSYVYAPGMSSTETQLARYCPDFIAATNERVTCSRGIETIQAQVKCCTFAEVNLQSNQERSKLLNRVGNLIIPLCAYWCAQHHLNKPYSSICSGIFFPTAITYALWNQINFALFSLKNKKNGVQVQQLSKNNSHSVATHWINPFKVNVAQDTDVAICKAKIDEAIAQESNKPQKVILYGVSRGSATVFSTCARHYSEQIAAVVCEGVFDTVNNILVYGNLFSRLKIGLLKYSKLTNFKADGISPITSALQMPKDVPIALITSIVDEVVPHQCTLNLYKKLRELGYTKVHILILKTSKHDVYPTGDEKEIYEAFIHAFYKRYNLPHIAKFAADGEKVFARS